MIGWVNLLSIMSYDLAVDLVIFQPNWFFWSRSRQDWVQCIVVIRTKRDTR